MSAIEAPFTLDQLLIVRTIAQQGSFRRAADALYVSQPAISLQIQNLERQLGVTLFDRGGRRVQLTEAGQVLVGYCERILNLCQEATRALAELQEMKRGSLTLGASQTVGTYVMPPLIGQFCQSYPQISVQLLVQSTRRIAHKLVHGELDLAIVGGEIPFDLQGSLTIIPFAQDEFVLVRAVPSVIGLPEEVLQIRDLLLLPFIALDSQSSTRHTLDRVLERYGINPAALQVKMELSSLEAIKNAVQAGLGVTFLSLMAVGRELERQSLQRLEVEGLQIKRTLWLAFNPDRYQSQAAQIFRQGLLQQQDWVKTPLPHLERLPGAGSSVGG
ncbi:MAG: LysR substrate-binding domain-containing protein [Cyanobacteriota bacterium]|nr:LysR substrate-binding domain-containing protein [Cyanobacteriota bacterium]